MGYMIKLLLAGIAAAFLLTGCGQAPKKTKIKVAYLPITHALALTEAAKQPEFGIEPVKYGSWPELLEALNSGRVDAAMVLIEPAMKAKEQGIDLKVLTLGHRDGNVVIGGKNIVSAHDFVGKTFAVPHRLSSHYVLFREYLEKNAIPSDTVKVTELAPAEMPSALASGRIAGYCVAEPFGAVSVEGGYGKILATSSELWKDSVCCALVIHEHFRKEAPGLVEKLRSACLQAGEKLSSPAGKLAAASGFLKQPDGVLARSLEWISFQNLILTEEAYADLTEKLKKYGLDGNAPSYESFVGEKH